MKTIIAIIENTPIGIILFLFLMIVIKGEWQEYNPLSR